MKTNKLNIEQKPHSAEYFVESRNFWWNSDFLNLMVKRLIMKDIKNVLDVGCGVGHWGQILSFQLSDDTKFTGIDREEKWIQEATKRAHGLGLSQRFNYKIGDATSIPFNDESFDLVTCQTVLIHLKDPKVALREMLRVLKPGGLLLLAEPNNFANRAIGSSLNENRSIDEIINRLKFDLTIQKGKQNLGLGFNSAGDLIPGYLNELGINDLKVFLSDKAVPIYSPYLTQEQMANIKLMKDWNERKFVGWDKDEMLSYYLAGGGNHEEFELNYNLLLSDSEATVDAIDHGTYHSAGGRVMYVISARK